MKDKTPMSENVIDTLNPNADVLPSVRFIHDTDEYVVKHRINKDRILDTLVISRIQNIDSVMSDVVIQTMHFDSNLSDDDKNMLLHTIASSRWMDCHPTQKGFTQINSIVLSYIKYFLSQGLSNVFSLRLAIIYYECGPAEVSSGDGSYELGELKKDFGRFQSVGYPIEMENKCGISNIECFFKLRYSTSENVALQMVRNCEGDWGRLESVWGDMYQMNLHRSALPYLEKFDYKTFYALALFSDVVEVDRIRGALSVCKMLSEMDKTQMKIISRIQNKIFLNKPLNEVLDVRDYDVDNCDDLYNDFLYYISKLDISEYIEINENITSILIGRFGLNNITAASRMLCNESVNTPKDIATLIYVATYLETNGPSDLPIEWIVAITEDCEDFERSIEAF